MFFLQFMLFPTFLETNNSGNKKLFSLYFLGNIEKCLFTYWLNGRWFLQIVDIGNFNIKLNGRWLPQIVDHVDRDSGNLYPIYIQKNIVVLPSEPVGGRSRATELPCLICNVLYILTTHTYILYVLYLFSYQVMNSDHTRNVLRNIFLKFNMGEKPENFFLFQVLPDKGTLYYIILLPYKRMYKSTSCIRQSLF